MFKYHKDFQTHITGYTQEKIIFNNIYLVVRNKMLWVLLAWGVLRVHLPVADEQKSLGPSLSSPVAEACLYLKSENWRVRGSLLGDWLMIRKGLSRVLSYSLDNLLNPKPIGWGFRERVGLDCESLKSWPIGERRQGFLQIRNWIKDLESLHWWPIERYDGWGHTFIVNTQNNL